MKKNCILGIAILFIPFFFLACGDMGDAGYFNVTTVPHPVIIKALPATQPVIKINKINKNYLGIDDELNYQYHILADTSRRRNVIIQDLK